MSVNIRDFARLFRPARPPMPATTDQQAVDGMVWAPGGRRWKYELTLSGALDLAGAPLLEAILRDAAAGGAREVHVDLAGVSFLSSAGLSVLVTARARLSDLGGRLVLEQPSWSVRRLVCVAELCELLGLDSGQDRCPHSAGAALNSRTSRYPAERIGPDRPLRITQVRVAGVQVADAQVTGVHAA
jgi:anti-sigma B factor antagonist